MSAYAFYFLGFVLVIFLIGFVAYYSYRLGSARKRLANETSLDVERLMRESASAAGRSPGPNEGVGSSVSRATRADPLDGLGASAGAIGDTGRFEAPSRTYERGPGLRAFTDEAVFMRLDKSGEIVFQIGEKPAMPLKFLLDAGARSVLQQLSRRATADFGQTWAILASEDEQGRLTMTRLA